MDEPTKSGDIAKLPQPRSQFEQLKAHRKVGVSPSARISWRAAEAARNNPILRLHDRAHSLYAAVLAGAFGVLCLAVVLTSLWEQAWSDACVVGVFAFIALLFARREFRVFAEPREGSSDPVA